MPDLTLAVTLTADGSALVAGVKLAREELARLDSAAATAGRSSGAAAQAQTAAWADVSDSLSDAEQMARLIPNRIGQGLGSGRDSLGGITDTLEQGVERVSDALIRAFMSGKTGAKDWGRVTQGIISSILSDLAQLALSTSFGSGGAGDSSRGTGGSVVEAVQHLFTNREQVASADSGSSACLLSKSNLNLLGKIGEFGVDKLGLNVTGGSASGMAGTVGVLGSAFSAGSMGGMLGSYVGTKTNSKAVGGLTGAAGGAIASMALAGSIVPGIGTLIGAAIGAIMALVGTQKKTSGPNEAAAVNVSNAGFTVGRVMQDNKGDLEAAQKAGDATAQYLNILLATVGASMNVAVDRELSAIWHFQKDDTWRSVVRNEEKTFASAEEAMVDVAKRTFAALAEHGEISGVSANVQKALDNSKAKDPEALANDIAFAAKFSDAVASMTNQLRIEDEVRTAGAEAAATLNSQIKEFHAKTVELGLDIGEATAATWTWIDGLIAGRKAVEYSELESAMVGLKAQWDNMIPVLQTLGYTAEQATARAAEGYANNLAILQSDASTELDARLRGARGESGIDEVKALMQGYEATLRDIAVVWRDDLSAQAIQAGKATETLSLQVAELAANGSLSAGDLRRLIETLADTPAAAQAASAALERVLEQSWDRAQSALLGAVGRDLPVDLQARLAGLTQGTSAWDLTVGAMMAPTLDLATAQGLVAALLEDSSVNAGEFSAALDLLSGALQSAKTAADAAAQVNAGLADRERALHLASLTEGPERVRAEQQAKITAEMDAAHAAGYSTDQLARLARVLEGEFTAAMRAARNAIRQTIDGVRGSVNAALLGDRQMSADELFLTTGFDAGSGVAATIRDLFAAVDAGLQPAEALRSVFTDLSALYKSGAICADRYQTVMQGVIARYQSGTQAMAQVQSSVRDYLTGLRTSISEYLDGLAVSDVSQLTVAEKLARAQSDFADQMAKARGGNGVSLYDQRAALDSITQYADRLLAVGLDWNASGLDQRALQDWVTAQLAGLPDQISELEMVRLEIAALNTDSATRAALIAATVEDAADTISVAIGLMRADLNGDLRVDWGEFQIWAASNAAELDAIATALGISNGSLGDIFAELDANGDGTISAVEAARAAIVTAVSANPSAIAASLNNHFSTLDSSVNGLLDYTEFRAGLSGMASDAELKKIFTELDTNGDQQLSRLELVRSSIVAAVNAQGASVTASGIASALYPYFNMLNTTSDQSLSYAEFTAGLAGSKVASDANMTSWFRELDANGDGQLSKLELMRAAEVATNGKLDTGNSTLAQLQLTMLDNRLNTLNTIHAINNAASGAINNAVAIIGAINALPHATGGPASGLTMINDAGPEFVRLPGGSHVVTASASIAMARQLASEIAPPSAQIIAMPMMTAPVAVATPAGGGSSDQVVVELARLTAAVDRLATRLPQGDQAVVNAVGEVVDAVKDVGKTIRQGNRTPVARRGAA